MGGTIIDAEVYDGQNKFDSLFRQRKVDVHLVPSLTISSALIIIFV